MPGIEQNLMMCTEAVVITLFDDQEKHAKCIYGPFELFGPLLSPKERRDFGETSRGPRFPVQRRIRRKSWQLMRETRVALSSRRSRAPLIRNYGSVEEIVAAYAAPSLPRRRSGSFAGTSARPFADSGGSGRTERRPRGIEEERQIECLGEAGLRRRIVRGRRGR